MDSAFLTPPPPGGVGMKCSILDQFSYGEVTVTGSKLTVTPKDMNGTPQMDGAKPVRPVRPELHALEQGADCGVHRLGAAGPAEARGARPARLREPLALGSGCPDQRGCECVRVVRVRQQRRAAARLG